MGDDNGLIVIILELALVHHSWNQSMSISLHPLLLLFVLLHAEPLLSQLSSLSVSLIQHKVPFLDQITIALTALIK